MLLRLFLGFIAIVVAAIYAYSKHRQNTILLRGITLAFTGYALLHIVWMGILSINHIHFPLNLEAMELAGLEHLQRILAGLPLYPAPSPDFIALAYNPLYYYLCVPFSWLFGPTLFTMRLVAILGMLGSGLLVFVIVRRETQSNWWGLMAAGLFASAYRAMDTYLDNAHRDSWLLCAILLGCCWIDLNRSRLQTGLGVLLLVSAFWLKQQGALFLIGGLLYLTWRDGWRRTWIYWLIATGLSAGLYLAMPAWLLGSHFHYYTWQVPRQWTEWSWAEVGQFGKFMLSSYLVLAAVSGITALQSLRQQGHKSRVWYFFWPVAFLSAASTLVTPGSNNNVWIPLGVWCILVGTIGLKQGFDRYPLVDRWELHLLGLGLSFALLLYNPLAVVVPLRANAVYSDLVSALQSLKQPVYAPDLGQLQSDYQFRPAIHWVPLSDLIRGPGVNLFNHPLLETYLPTVLHPATASYLLLNFPLEQNTLFGFLSDRYRLAEDFGERFQALATLPKRYSLGYPRYLYQFSPPLPRQSKGPVGKSPRPTSLPAPLPGSL